MSKKIFIVVAKATGSSKNMIFAIKEKSEHDATGRVAQYINRNVQDESYSIHAWLSFADVDHVQLLEVNR